MYYYSSFIILFVLMMLVAVYVYWRSGLLITFYGGNATRGWARLARACVALVIGYLCRNTWNTKAMVLLHLIVLFLLLDGMALVLRKVWKKKKETGWYRFFHRVYQSGVIPLVLFVLVMGYGFYNMGQIHKAEYQVATVKSIQDYQIVLLSDIHYDTVQSTEVLQKAIEEINGQNPDIVVLDGDIVEEGTSKEKMEEAFSVLGKMKNKYGIFYVYGNHDRQPYTKQRTYTEQELEAAIKKNGIQILQDCYVRIQDDLIVAGRDDAAWSGTADRKTTEEILKDVPREEKEKKFVLMLDHQPIQVEENGLSGVDLQLSGHTHAGQIWPVGVISEMTGVLNYGMYHCGTCRAIVSSGVAGWRYRIRTGSRCEYAMIHLHQQSVSNGGGR